MQNNTRTRAGLAFLLPCLGLSSLLVACSDAPVPNDPSPTPVPELSEELQADLQAAIDQAVTDGKTPGVVLHVSGENGAWSTSAGVAEIESGAALTPKDRVRAGSTVKTLVATAVLQSAEKGALGLDDVLTDLLPPAVTASIPHADSIDVRMLLGHRSGIAEWLTPAVRKAIVTDPAHVWTVDEMLDSVEAQTPKFDPGTAFGYSNTNYVLLGEILTAVHGRSWREVVREDVIDRAGLENSTLPDPGTIECDGCAHGYVAMNGAMLDATEVDPSMSGAAGGHAFISTAADLARLLEQLRSGALFDHEETLDTMMAFQPASDPPVPLTAYGAGLMELTVGDDVVIGHLGGTVGYMSFMLYVPSTDRYVSGYINIMGDPGVVITPVVELLAQE